MFAIFGVAASVSFLDLLTPLHDECVHRGVFLIEISSAFFAPGKKMGMVNMRVKETSGRKAYIIGTRKSKRSYSVDQGSLCHVRLYGIIFW